MTKAIPSLAFSFFDPENKQYQTLHSATIPLQISGGGEPGKNAGKVQDAGSKGTESGNDQGLTPDNSNGLELAPLHPEMGALQRSIIPLISRPWFQLIVLAAVLLLITAIVLKIRARLRLGDPVRSRRQEMTRRLDNQMREIQVARDQGDTRAFLALSRQAMQEQLGALWQMEPGAITLADLRQRLAADATLLSLFGTAETSAYGGCQLSSQEMTEYTQKLEAELRRLA